MSKPSDNKKIKELIEPDAWDRFMDAVHKIVPQKKAKASKAEHAEKDR